MKTTLHIFLLVCIFLPGKIFCQAYWGNYELFNTHSGLPNSTVLSIAQDDNNLLLIGTRNGLCIYDGFDFEIKRFFFDDKDGEWSNIFCCLFKDNKGNIWMATQSGRIAKYDPQADSLTLYAMKNAAYKEFVTCCYQDMSGAIWMGTNDGNLYSVQKESTELTKHPSVTEHQYINCILEDYSGDLWLNGYYLFRPPHKNKNTGHDKHRLFLKIRSKNIDIHKNTGHVTTIQETEILNKYHYVFHVTKSGRLLLATSQLVKEFDADGKLLNRIVISDDEHYNNEDIANFIFEDATGIWWLGTNSGLIKIDKDKCQFIKFSTNSNYGKLNSNYIRSVFADTNTIWAGFKAGMANRLTFDSNAKKYTSTSCIYNRIQPAFLAINVIRKLRSGTLMFGSANGLFYAINGQPVLYDFLLRDGKESVVLQEVWSIYEDQAGRIWVGTRGQGLYIVEPVTRSYRHYPYAHLTSNPLGLTTVWQIFEDHKGDIWLATENGLDSVVIASNGYAAGFYNIHNHYKGEAGRQVWSVTEDNKKRLWISTTVNGISMVDKSRQEFITYNKNNGLQGNVVCGMLADPKGYLWISTLNGISRFDVENRTFIHITENDGLPGNDFNFNACCRAPSGHLFFGSKSGLITFHPDSILKKKTIDVPVLVRTFNVGNKKYLDNPDPRKPIILNYDQNSFSFRFALPHFASAANCHYQYMLEGFNDYWITTDNKHPMAAYTNIPPGRYALLVRGSVNGQQWSSKPLKLNIIIQPAFWQKPLFITGILLAIILAIAYFIYTRFRRSMTKEREKNRINQKFTELEFRALQAQMNPHFIFNSINAIQHFMFTNNELAANSYLSKFAHLMRLYLESSKNKYIPLAEEIELLKLYIHLEKLRFEDKFDYTFSADPDLQNTTLQIPSMLLQPYVENAINHGLALRSSKGLLEISFTHTGKNILCIIDDNGVGRTEAGRHRSENHARSRGTDNINDRLSIYRQVDNIEIKAVIIDKTDESGNSMGTRVEVYIPKLI